MTAPISLHVAEDQFEGLLRTWIVDYLGAAVASDPALARIDAAELAPLVWARADEWDPDLAFESHYLPAVFITCSGTEGPAYYDEGARIEPVNVGLRVVAENVRGGDQIIGCNRLTRLYAFALTNLLEQHRGVSASFVINEVGRASLPADQSRGLAFCDIELQAHVCTASTDPAWLENPTFGEVPRLPDAPVVIETVDVTVEAA